MGVGGFQISMERGWKKIKNEQAGNTSILYSIVAISQKMVLLTRKQKCTKKCVIKQEIKFTGKVNKFVQSANDDKSIQTPDGVLTYPYGLEPRIVCREKRMKYSKIKHLI